jgi:hypothetical protein
MSATELNQYCELLRQLLMRLAPRIRIDKYGGPAYVCGEDEVSEVMLEVSAFLTGHSALKFTKNNCGPVTNRDELTLWATRRLLTVTDTNRMRLRRAHHYFAARPETLTDGAGSQPAGAEHPIFARNILEALYETTLPDPVAHGIFRLIVSCHLRAGTLDLNPCDRRTIADITGATVEEVGAAFKSMVTLKNHLLDQPPLSSRKKRKPKPKGKGRPPRASKGKGDLP